MSKLTDFYKLKPKFGEYANEEQQKKLKDMEWALVNEEVIPEIKAALSKILSKVQCPLEFSVSYVPSTDLVIDTGGNMAHEEPFHPVAVFTHPLDWSSFNYGMTIESKFHQAVFNALGLYIPRSRGVEITLLIDKLTYKVKITNADRKVNGDTIRLLYKGKIATPGDYLKGKYPDAYKYLKEMKEAAGSTRKQFELPPHLAKTMILKTTPKPLTFQMEIK